MLPIYSGRYQWSIFDDLASSVDSHQSRFDILMRIPTGGEYIARVKKYGDLILQDDVNHTQMQDYNLMMDTNYARNLMMSGLHPIKSTASEAVNRISSLEIVNRARIQRDQLPIKLDTPKSSAHNLTCNKPLMYKVAAVDLNDVEETYEIVHCRQTKVPLFNNAHFKQVLGLQSHSDTLDLDPEYYESPVDTWVHRAINYQGAAANVLNGKGGHLLNPCQECSYCYMNTPFVNDDFKLDDEKCAINVSHRKTIHEYADQMFLALGILLGCSMCQHHFSFHTQHRYLTNLEARCHFNHAILWDSPANDGAKTPLLASWMSEPKVALIQRNTQMTPEIILVERALGRALVYAHHKPSKVTTFNRFVPKSIFSTSTINKKPLFGHERVTKESIEIISDKIFQLSQTKLRLAATTAEGSQSRIPDETSLLAEILGSQPNDAEEEAVFTFLFGPHKEDRSTYSKFLQTMHNSANAVQGKSIMPFEVYASHLKLFRGCGGAAMGPVWTLMITYAMAVARLSLDKKEDFKDSVERLKDGTNQYMVAYADIADDSMIETYIRDHKERVENIIKRYWPEQFEKTSGDLQLSEDDLRFIVKRSVENRLVCEAKIRQLFAKYWPKEDIKEKSLYLSDKEMRQIETGSTADKMAYERSMHLIGENDVIRQYMLMHEQGFFHNNSKNMWRAFISVESKWRALNSYLEAKTVMCHLNPYYESLVGRIWPIPNEYKTRPHEWLFDQMWIWHIDHHMLKSLVMATLTRDEVYQTTAGNGTANLTPANMAEWINIKTMEDEFYAIYDERKMHRRFKMPIQWMNRFKKLYFSQLSGQNYLDELFVPNRRLLPTSVWTPKDDQQEHKKQADSSPKAKPDVQQKSTSTIIDVALMAEAEVSFNEMSRVERRRMGNDILSKIQASSSSSTQKKT